MSNGMDCLCLIETASVPFQVPINRTLAISLPRACNMPGVPVQCKAPAPAPAPAPGRAAFGPTASPKETPSPSPSSNGFVAPKPTSSALVPVSDLTPPSTTTGATTTGGSRSVDQPTSSAYILSPSLLLFFLGFLFLKYY